MRHTRTNRAATSEIRAEMRVPGSLDMMAQIIQVSWQTTWKTHDVSDTPVTSGALIRARPWRTIPYA